MARQTHQTTPSLHDLYPDLNEQAIASAAQTLDQYVDLVARITERIVNDPEALAEFRSLTQGGGIRKMKPTFTPASDQ